MTKPCFIEPDPLGYARHTCLGLQVVPLVGVPSTSWLAKPQGPMGPGFWAAENRPRQQRAGYAVSWATSCAIRAPPGLSRLSCRGAQRLSVHSKLTWRAHRPAGVAWPGRTEGRHKGASG